MSFWLFCPINTRMLCWIVVSIIVSNWFFVEVLLLCLYHCLRTVLMVLSSTGTSSHHDSTLETSVHHCAGTVLLSFLLTLCHCTWLYFPAFNLTSSSSSPFLIRILVDRCCASHFVVNWGNKYFVLCACFDWVCKAICHLESNIRSSARDSHWFEWIKPDWSTGIGSFCQLSVRMLKSCIHAHQLEDYSYFNQQNGRGSITVPCLSARRSPYG